MHANLSYAIKYVSNMGEAVRFHRDQLGLALRFESPHWSEFETGETTLALHLASADHPAGTCQLGFGVPDIDAFHRAKAGQGVEFTSPPVPLHGQKLAKFADTDGAECSLSEPRPAAPRQPVLLQPGDGRAYPMGRISALFKADGGESAGRYAISEWWLDANTKGPGAHAHPEDDVFYVLEGTMSFLVGDSWHNCPAGSFVLAPGGAIHDFENRSRARAGVLNISVPGNFEPHMPSISDWFIANPPEDA